MALKPSLLLAFFLLVTGSLAYRQQQQQQQQQNQCQLNNIDALEPRQVVQAEAGVTEFWDSDDQQFQCAGVEFVRHRIQPGGLFLPSYVNTPLLSYVERGRGVQGVILPGCPETFELQTEVQHTDLRFHDRHQKVQELRQGDILAIPAGAAHWVHNDGDNELVIVVFFDTQNNANQLDQNQWRFFLAGNPQGQSQQQQQPQQGRRPSRRPTQKGRQQGQSSPRNPNGNIFQGFDVEFLAQAFNVDRETAEKLQGQNDQRGHIVNVDHLRVVQPPRYREEEEQGEGGWGRQHGGSNGVEETICSMKLISNINHPSHADFVNPLAGEIASLNSFKFPILQQLQLSAERGFLHPNAIQSPAWILNAHNLVYVTQGSMRLQIVNNQGQSVFDDELREGQLVVIPQSFAAVKRANQEGCRWIAFRTNDNAMVSNLAGRVSALRSLPLDVVANSFQLSREDAQQLKNNQQQAVLFSPSGRSQQGRSPA